MRRIVTLGFAMAPFLMMGISGCRPEGDGTASTNSTEAFKASSPACVAAHDACRAQADPLVAAIKAACAQVGTACARHPADGGGAAGNADASALTCDDARAACTNQIAMSKDALQAAGQSCEASIRMACTVNRRADGGSPIDAGTPVSTDASVGPSAGGAGGGDAAAADPCKAAQEACHQQLGQIRSMPPAACTSAQTACSGQGLLDISGACKTASSACQAALQSTLSSTLDSCGTAIVSACARHVH